MSRKTIKFSGVEKVILNFERSNGAVHNGARAGIKALRDRVWDDSQKWVPVETTALKKSGFKGPIVSKGNKVSASISYGAGLDYAVYVHEDLQAKHKSPTSAKWLERAYVGSRAYGPPVFSAEVRAALRKSI